MKHKYISIIIPCYNSAMYMQRAIDSALVGGDDVEIIIVDDGSTKDDTFAIAKRYEDEHPTIVRAIHQDNLGHGGAINTGLASAKGDFIKVLDSDDRLFPDALSYVIEKIKSFGENKPDVYFTNFVYEKEGKSYKKRAHFENAFPSDKFFTWDNSGKLLLTQYIIMHNIMYSRELLKRCALNLPEHMFYVDNIFVFDPLPFTETLYYSDVDLYGYFIGREDQSVNESVMVGRLNQQIFITKRIIDTYIERKDMCRRQQNCNRYILKYLEMMLTVSNILMIIDASKEAEEKRIELWSYLKSRDEDIYKKMRTSFLGKIMNPKGEMGRKFTIFGYRALTKYIGWN